jgi:hypothetical protein
MDTFDALEDTTWVNFASLANEHLFAAPKGAGQMIDGKEEFGEALHDYMMKELRIKSVPIPTRPEEGEKEIKLPELDKPVHYVTPLTKFPTLEELQGSKKTKNGEEGEEEPIELLDWLKDREDKLFGQEPETRKKEMHLHPRATHFIFFVRLDSTQLSAIVLAARDYMLRAACCVVQAACSPLCVPGGAACTVRTGGARLRERWWSGATVEHCRGFPDRADEQAGSG